MANLKVTEIVSKYVDSATSGDISDWIERLELVTKLENLEGKLATILPMLLDGPAFAVYKQLSDEDKADVKKSKEALLAAFGVDCYQAYQQFTSRRMRESESVDVFMADLRKLSLLIGMKEKEVEPMLRCAFITGLPFGVSIQVKSIAGLEKMTLSELVSRARVIHSASDGNDGVCAAGARKRKFACYRCGKTGHMSWQCREQLKEPDKDAICFKCGQTGHMSWQCREQCEELNIPGRRRRRHYQRGKPDSFASAE